MPMLQNKMRTTDSVGFGDKHSHEHSDVTVTLVAYPYGVAITPNGEYAYIANGSDTVLFR